MSIIVRNAKLPESCLVCPACQGDECWFSDGRPQVPDIINHRAKWCPMDEQSAEGVEQWYEIRTQNDQMYAWMSGKYNRVEQATEAIDQYNLPRFERPDESESFLIVLVVKNRAYCDGEFVSETITRTVVKKYGGERKPKNTCIEYLYRDGSNYKRWNSVIVAGAVTDAQRKTIADSLDCGEYFMPEQVGLPADRMDEYPRNDDDVEMLELDPIHGITITDKAPTVAMTIDELTSKFAAAKNHWEL